MGIRTIHPIIGTAAELAAANYTLYDNQMAVERDTGLVKYGDGSTAYTDLAYNPQAPGNNVRVRAATTANITIATALNAADVLDGVTLAAGDIVLVKNQTAAEGNGVYIVGVTPARSTTFDTYNEHPGSIVTVAEGTANADRVYLCTSNAGGTLDTTAITYSDFGLVVGASHTATATAAGSTTLTVVSNEIQEFTGSTTQTIVLPVVTTLPRTGWKYRIINNSSGALTVNSSGANLVQTIPAGGEATLTCILLTGTTAASWRSSFITKASSAGAMTLTTPDLGTPSAGVLTNVTGTAAGLTAGNVTTNANLTGHITSVGNAAVLGSFTSAQLATALTNETGSGLAVFDTSPTLTNETLAAGTASLAPLVYTAGTNLTSPIAGANEFDGASYYQTIDTTSGRGAVAVEQYFRLTAAGGTISTIANYFGATSNISLVASAFYEIDIYAYFLNSTSGTVVWTLTNSAAPTSQNIYYEMSPASGIVAPPGTATMLIGQIPQDATATKALTATAALTDAVNHFMHMKIFLQNGTGTSLKIQATKSAGTITPGVGSYWKARRLPAASTGSFAA